MTSYIEEYKRKSGAMRQALWDACASAKRDRGDLVYRPPCYLDQQFERGEGTQPATQAYERQAAALAAAKVVRQTSRRRPTPEERDKEVRRRRAWGGGSNMPSNLREQYTEAERAALSVIADQCRKKGFCDLCIKEIAKISGVKRTSVQNAIRKARSKERAQISVRERPQQGLMNLPNIIKIICRDWLGWIGRSINFKRLKTGFKGMSTSETGDKKALSESVETAKMAFERECVVAAQTPLKAATGVEKYFAQWGRPWVRGTTPLSTAKCDDRS